MENKNLNRREFLKRAGLVTGGAMAMLALDPFSALAQDNDNMQPGENKMTYRTQHGTGEKISLLGFGMMRLPRDNQELVNQLIDYAIAHGVNYFDTAPMYGRGMNEEIVGNALSRHPRDKYYVATKMSNYDEKLWNLEEIKNTIVYELNTESNRKLNSSKNKNKCKPILTKIYIKPSCHSPGNNKQSQMKVKLNLQKNSPSRNKIS